MRSKVSIFSTVEGTWLGNVNQSKDITTKKKKKLLQQNQKEKADDIGYERQHKL